MQLVVDGIMMVLSPNGALGILLGLLSLSNGWPVVDGVVYRDATMQIVEQSQNLLVVDYSLGEDVGQMRVRISTTPSQNLSVQYSMRNVPGNRNFYSFGLRFDSVAGLHRYLRNGYHSWDGSYFVQPGEIRRLGYSSPRFDLGYGATELVPTDGKNALVLGFDRHDRFQQSFTFGNLGATPDLTILTWWDQKQISPGDEPASENLVVLQDSSYEAGLRRWAQIVAATSAVPARTKIPPVIGWNSWYNLYNFISEPLIRETLQGVASVSRREQLPMNAFVIDSGFTGELGDWLVPGYSFPNGLAPVLQEIKQNGFTPGLWIAPLLVGNRSRLYRDHPDWVLKNRATGGPMLLWSFFGENRLGHARSEEYYILDPTNPAALDHLRTVFRTWRREWGAEIFKIDATVLGMDWGPREVSYFQPGLTRIEVWRKFAQAVRDEIGDDAVWMGSGQPLWASVGIADTMRIGGDVGVQWSGTFSADSLLRDLPARNFANHILWQVDPDPVLLRNQYHFLSDAEVRSLALFTAMSGGVMMTSDNLAELSPDRLDLWKSLLGTNKASARYPLLGREDSIYVLYQNPFGGPPEPVSFLPPLIVQVRDNPDGGNTVHIINISSDRISKTIALRDLGIEGSMAVYDWSRKTALPGSTDRLTISLDAHNSTLLVLSRAQGVSAAPED